MGRRSDHTSPTRRSRQPWPKDRPFRILSIDGGGIKGVFPAAYLAELERVHLGNASIGAYFDLVAGTSTGGIIALGLAAGMTANDTLKIYSERGATIFPPKRGFGALWQFGRWAGRPKYDQSVLKHELEAVFGSAILDDAKVRVVIPSFEGRYGDLYVYKTPHHPDFHLDRMSQLAHVALHTAAAPSFFASVENGDYVMVDGGLWANNPTMIAVIEAISCFDVPLENIRVLSIGTGDALVSTGHRRNAGWAGWILPDRLYAPLVFTAAVRAQSDNAIGQAGLLIGPENVVRVAPSAEFAGIGMDDVGRAILELPAAAIAETLTSGARVAEVFLATPASQFVKCPAIRRI